ncbi:MAG TPA: ABC transporter ATP-binding protein [Chloroflexota bacterium]
MTNPPVTKRGLLVRYLRPQGARVVVLAVLLIGGTLLQLVNPRILQAFIDAASSRAGEQRLLIYALVFIGVAISQQGLSVFATYLSERVAWTATNSLRSDLALHCLRLDLSFHKERTPGELIERIDGDVTALASFFSQFVIQILGSLLLLVGVLIALWVVDWRVGAALTVFAVVSLLAIVSVRSLAIPFWRVDRQASAALFGFIEERLAGTVDIRANGARPYVMRRLYHHTRERLRAGNKARLIGSVTWSVPVLSVAIGNAIALALAGWLYRHGGLSLGTAFIIYYYTQLLFQPMHLISNQLDTFQKASAGFVRIRDLLETSSALVDGPRGLIPSGPLAVAFQGVSFGYEGDDLVARDLDFRIEPAHVLGLLGRTGSGKTTITRLLLRLYDPRAGSITLGGVELRAAHRADIRHAIGVVTQDVQLFRATVRENLTFFDAQVDDARIMAALLDLGLADWYRSLPEGLDTMIGSGGSGLSAGEAQLLAFTRVFLKNPRVIILDEASSRLDPATERLVEQAVEKLLQGRTGIIIAHRLATVRRVDEILILEDGRVAEYGRREALARDGASRFAGLLRAGLEEVLV